MKAEKHGNRYRISYWCKNYPYIIHESFDTKEEADLRIAQILLEKKRGTLLPPAELVDPDTHHDLACETMTVAQLMEEYVIPYGLKHWGDNTLSCNRHRIDDYIVPYIGNIPIKMLTPHRLEKYYCKLLKEPAVKLKGREHENKTISPSVVEKIHSIIKSAMNQAIRWGYLKGTNPAITVELPKFRKNKRTAWNIEEAQHALSVCEDLVLRLCMILALGCSMRIGEILGLTWDCVHIDDDLCQSHEANLDVEKELRRCDKQSLANLDAEGRNDIFFTFPSLKRTGSSTVLVLKTPKTESSIRRIYLPERVIEELKQAKERQTAIQGQIDAEYQNFNLVVAQDNGRPYEEHLIMQKLRKLISTHNLTPIVFHSLRHTSTSMKLKLSGGDIKSVQGDTGHSQSDMVTDVYSHIFDENRKHLARKVNDNFFSYENKKTASSNSAADESAQKLMKLLQGSPEQTQKLLQIYELMGGNL